MVIGLNKFRSAAVESTQTGEVRDNVTYFRAKTSMPAVPLVETPDDYRSAIEKYQDICKSIPMGDFNGIKSAWADELCLRLVDYELQQGIEA